MPVDDYPSRSDPELIAAALDDHDRQAWEALVVRYQRLVYSIPLRLGLSEADAADIFQTVWMRLLENLATLRNRERLGAWLAVTTHRQSWAVLQQRRRSTLSAADLPLEDTLSDAPDLEDAWLQLEQQTLVRAVIDRLGPPCQRLLTLLYYKDPPSSYSDLSRLLSIPIGSVGPTRARCLEKVIKTLESMNFFD
jgi:RNA polymerase sigma factor (sigma-70 family)